MVVSLGVQSSENDGYYLKANVEYRILNMLHHLEPFAQINTF